MSAYSNYYTSADTLLFVESDHIKSSGTPVLLDKLETIAFSEGVSARPVYGIGQPIFGFSNVGNVLVSGELVVRFVHQDYLLKAIKHALGDNQLTTQDAASAFQNQSAAEVRANKVQADVSSKISNSRILNMPYYFNLRLVLNNGNLYHDDINKELVIKDVRILGSELVSSVSMTGPVNVKYKFMARMVT